MNDIGRWKPLKSLNLCHSALRTIQPIPSHRSNRGFLRFAKFDSKKTLFFVFHRAGSGRRKSYYTEAGFGAWISFLATDVVHSVTVGDGRGFLVLCCLPLPRPRSRHRLRCYHPYAYLGGRRGLAPAPIFWFDFDFDIYSYTYELALSRSHTERYWSLCTRGPSFACIPTTCRMGPVVASSLWLVFPMLMMLIATGYSILLNLNLNLNLYLYLCVSICCCWFDGR